LHLADVWLREKFGIGKYGCERLAKIMGNMRNDPGYGADRIETWNFAMRA
jgi:hypothetical protein